ncbi:Uncharacterized protein CLAVI_000840 [Candidatus Clavichlamydia salmonicola]|uniref:HrpJ domain-containing protein n=1 Tax=Candidatus Clavichlamydia salmonicola TaxID=469812 RepID=UPI0018917EDB|nr:HrpJ domain-containing protein [Candidatus Clavichlamydia salmonicola]MBF5051202.1 Uncharacterized protein [Candidatus Clavichlamydia salmonicola]
MAASSSKGIGGYPTIDVASLAAKAAAAEAKEIAVAQQESQAQINDNPDFTNPAAATRVTTKLKDFKTLAQRRKSTETSTPDEKKVEGIEDKQEEDLAEHEQQETPELEAPKLRELKAASHPEDTVEDVLSRVSAMFPDPVLALKALTFLEESVPASDTAAKNLIIQAKTKFMAENPRAIRAGVNIASELYVGSSANAADSTIKPSALRGIYHDVTGNIQTHQEMFQLLSKSYSLPEIKSIAKFLLRGMAAELRTEGASIEHPKLRALMSETYTLQAVLRVYGFFESSRGTLSRSFSDEGLKLPDSVTTKDLALAFTNLIGEKFLNTEKVKRVLEPLVGNNPIGQSCILNMFYQGLYQVSPRTFSTLGQRQQLQLVISNTLDLLNKDNENYPQPGSSAVSPKGAYRE